jgi:hypothetical protein
MLRSGRSHPDYSGGAYPEAVREWRQSRRLYLWLAAGAIGVLFIALNLSAYDGFFSDDDLDTLSWALGLSYRRWAPALITPVFSPDNFRPVGHIFYLVMGRAFGLEFPPWITPVFAIHLLNGALLFLLMRRLEIRDWFALAGSAFLLSAQRPSMPTGSRCTFSICSARRSVWQASCSTRHADGF